MPKPSGSAAAIGLPSPPPLGLSPALRRSLECIAETVIDLLDAADAYFEDLEDTDIDDAGDDEGAREDDADLGWITGTGPGNGNFGNDEEYLVEPESSAGLRRSEIPCEAWGANRAQFDPRLAMRGANFGDARHAFPHDPPNRPRFDLDTELLRLGRALARLRRSPRGR